MSGQHFSRRQGGFPDHGADWWAAQRDWAEPEHGFYAFCIDIHQAATGTDAGRLFAWFIRICLLAQTRKIEFALAGEEAERGGLASKADWLLLEQV